MANSENSLLVEKYRPSKLENYVGNENIKKSISKYLEQNDILNLIFYGPAGTGKTTFATILLKISIAIIFILMPLMKEVLKRFVIKYKDLRALLLLNHLKWSFWMKLIFLLYRRRLHSVILLKLSLVRQGLL